MSSPSVRDKSFDQSSSGRSNIQPATVILCAIGVGLLSGGLGALLGDQFSRGSVDWDSFGACLMYTGGAFMTIGLLNHYCSHRARQKANESQIDKPQVTTRQSAFETTSA